MTDDEKKQWLDLFPGWPNQLTELFSNEMSLQLRAMQNVADEFSEFYNSAINIGRYFSFSYDQINNKNPTFGVSILSPSNPGYTISRSFSQYRWFNWMLQTGVPWIGYAHAGNDTTPGIVFYFDRRLFGDGLSASIADWGPNTTYSDQSYTGYVTFYFGNPAAQYIGTESLLILGENGIKKSGVDYAKLSDFFTYVNAYKKFSAEIKATADLEKQKSNVLIQNFKNDLVDKLNTEKRSLENLSIQVLSQLRGEASSAKRDFLNMFLQIQTLKQTLVK